jgi:SAM-dependent methyltransferase
VKFELSEERVIKDIAPDDDMHALSVEAANPNLYFDIGRQALVECIAPALDLTYRQRFRRILDMPCGYGRVLRYLRAAFPESEIVACDIQRKGVDFCAATFGATPVYSSEDPQAIELSGEFDLIWCGSLLTHLDAGRWEAFLDLFESALARGGILVFTTHGRHVAFRLRTGLHSPVGWLGEEGAARLLDDYDASGFGYREYSNWDQDFEGQTETYGWTLSAPAWVTGEVTKRLGWRLVSYRERAWTDFQDVVACLREPIDELPPGLQARLGELETGNDPAGLPERARQGSNL